MLLEFISHAMAFDLVWIASLIMNNLHWLFALVAYVVIAHNGKRPIWQFLLVITLLWAITDFTGMMGWVMVPLLTFMIISFVMPHFIDGTALEKHSLKITIILFLMLSFVHTFLFNLELF